MHREGHTCRRARPATVLTIAGLLTLLLATFSVFTYLQLSRLAGSPTRVFAQSQADVHCRPGQPAYTATPSSGDLKKRAAELELVDGGAGPEKRQLGLPSLPNPFAPATSGAAGGTGGIGSFFSSIGDALGGLASGLIPDLQGPALALGLGIGSGSASGLNLTTADKAMAKMTKMLEMYNVSGGVDGIAANLGTGLSSSLLGLVNVSSLTSSLGGLASNISINASDVQPYALALGTGIGNGTASGLELSPQAKNIMPANATDLPGVAGTFTFSLTKSVVSNVDLATLASLNLSAGGDLLAQVTPYLSPGLLGLGQGLGFGAEVVLQLQPAPELAEMQKMTDRATNASVRTVVANFGMGLVSSLFTNVSASDLVNKATAVTSNPALTSKFNVKDLNLAPIAEGFARGFVQGAGDAVQAYGGIQALMNGTAPEAVNVPNNTIKFDDSIGGGAAGFGQGLGGQGVIVARQLIGNFMSGSSPTTALAVSTNTSRKVSRRTPRGVLRRGGTDDAAPFNVSALLDDATISTLTQTGVDALTCKGVGGIVSIGVGLILSGTIPLSTLTTVNATGLVKNALPNGTIVLHNEGNTYEISTTAVNTGETSAIINGVQVNGINVVAFGVLLVFHIILGITVFTAILPAVAMIQYIMSVMEWITGKPVADHFPKWVRRAVPISWATTGIATPVILVFGIAVAGSGRHFQDVHAISGLLLTLIAVPASVFFFRPPKPSPVPAQPRRFVGLLGKNDLAFLLQYGSLGLGILVVTSGFSSLASVAFCATNALDGSLWLAFGLGLGMQWAVAFALGILELLRRYGWKRQHKGGQDNASPADRGWVIRLADEKTAVPSPGPPPVPPPMAPPVSSTSGSPKQGWIINLVEDTPHEAPLPAARPAPLRTPERDSLRIEDRTSERPGTADSSRERIPGRDRERERSWNRDRERARERDRERDRERPWERDREREQDRERDRDHERDRDYDRDRDRDRERERDRDRARERDRERERERERERDRERERERDRQRGWERYR